ncbi:hypothetical protein Q5P01_011360 [Channa striata]|uniref:Transmembrane protein 100 n=1 Tax=Channa striata TaxID=64152 RepID=A0AA88MT46_CHASR|nr:hypothetical protein Q5P01_011360 [Channa striata]
MLPFLHPYSAPDSTQSMNKKEEQAAAPLNLSSNLMEESKPTPTTKMEMLDPSALSDVPSAVTFHTKTESVTLPRGVTSVVGITVVTGGAELTCGSCMLAFCFWATLIGFSCVGVGLWEQVNQQQGGTSHLLGLGIVILVVSLVTLLSVVMYHCLTKKTQEQREDGKEVLVEDEKERRLVFEVWGSEIKFTKESTVEDGL